MAEMTMDRAEELVPELVEELDRTMAVRGAFYHSATCSCDRCILEFSRAVYNRLQNRRGGFGVRWGIGSDTATGACHDLLDDPGARAMRPIGDFHRWATEAVSMPAERRLPWVFLQVRESFLRKRPGTGMLERTYGMREASPAEIFLLKASEHWNRIHAGDGKAFPKKRIAHALLLLIVTWTRGLVMEGIIMDSMQEALDTGRGEFARLMARFSRIGGVKPAPDSLEGRDVDAMVLVVWKGKALDVLISVKSGRAMGEKTIALTRSQRGKDAPMLYVGTRKSYASHLDPEDLTVLRASQAEAEMNAYLRRNPA